MKNQPKTGGLFDDLETPAYLRRQKAADPRGARRRRLPGTRTVIFTILGLFVMSFVAWKIFGFLRQDSRFQLQAIELRGERYLSPAEVGAVFHADQGRNIYDLPLELRRAELEQLSWVHQAAVTRVLPAGLRITVEERIPLAFLWTPHGIGLVDAEGVILDAPPNAEFTFPVLRGVSEQEPLEQRRAKLQQFIQLMSALEASSPLAPGLVSEVRLADPRNLQLVISDGFHAVLLHIGQEDFQHRFESYSGHIVHWRQQFAEIESIDLRYAGQAVIHAGTPRGVSVETGSAISSDTSTDTASALPGPSQGVATEPVFSAPAQ